MRDSDKSDFMDALTGHFSQAMDMLFMRSRTKTGLGFMLGIVCYFIAENVIRLTKIALNLPVYFWIALNIVILNCRNLFHPHAIDEELETKMYYIDKAQKKGNIPQSERRQQWRNFIALVNEKAVATVEKAKSEKAAEESLKKKSDDNSPIAQ